MLELLDGVGLPFAVGVGDAEELGGGEGFGEGGECGF